MTVKELLKYGIEELNSFRIDDSILKSRILLAYYLDKPKEFLISHDDMEVPEGVEKLFLGAIKKLENNVPVQYITNNQEFMKLKFFVDENVLIPRADTECLVEEVLKKAKDGDKVFDLCTGSGAIGISIKKYKPKVQVFASDISREALNVALKNSSLNNCDVNFIESDLFSNIEVNDFDIIVSNPPYISKEEMSMLEGQVQKEPNIALYGGLDGLDFYKKIAKEAKKFLKENGLLFVEIGYKQKLDVINIFKENGYTDINCIKDLSGNDRVVIGKNKKE